MDAFEKVRLIHEDDKVALMKERAGHVWSSLPQNVLIVLEYMGARLDTQGKQIQRAEGEKGELERRIERLERKIK